VPDASSTNTAPTRPEQAAVSRRGKAGKLYAASSGAAQIFIDDNHTLKAERLRPFSQIILASLSFRARAHLLRRPLPDINIGVTFNVTRLNLLAHRSAPPY
jgi:hypothetical protein